MTIRLATAPPGKVISPARFCRPLANVSVLSSYKKGFARANLPGFSGISLSSLGAEVTGERDRAIPFNPSFGNLSKDRCNRILFLRTNERDDLDEG